MIEKDPSDDREEFKGRLDCIFDWRFVLSSDALIEEIALTDGHVSAETKAKIQGCKDKVDQYLAQWDSAVDKKGREDVVNKVKK